MKILTRKNFEWGGIVNNLRKCKFFLKIKNFHSSLILLEPVCKIWKSLKNRKLVSQFAQICLIYTGVFLRIQDLKLLLAQKLWNFIRNHKFFFIIWFFSIIWDLVDQNLLRIERKWNYIDCLKKRTMLVTTWVLFQSHQKTSYSLHYD